MPLISRRTLEVAIKWAPSGFIFGVTGALATIYATDWKVVARYIPYYGGKFKEEPES